MFITAIVSAIVSFSDPTSGTTCLGFDCDDAYDPTAPIFSWDHQLGFTQINPLYGLSGYSCV